MILCLNIGNTHIFGGVFSERKLLFQFRCSSSLPYASDQLGIFFKNLLRENELDYKGITQASISSVVPSLNYSIRSALIKYFSVEPFFLKAGVKTGLKIEYKSTHELGADRIANAIAAIHQFPEKNIIVISLGTATVLDALSAQKSYRGGVIFPGLSIAMQSLSENTAQLPKVNIVKPEKIIGQTTLSNIQSGLYYSHLGALREIIQRIKRNEFVEKEVLVIGTGGFAHLFEEENIFDVIIPDLVLQGLRIALEKNCRTKEEILEIKPERIY